MSQPSASTRRPVSTTLTKLGRRRRRLVYETRRDWNHRWMASGIGWRWAGRGGRVPLLCIGDSHLKATRRVAARGDLPRITIRRFSKGGATASGADNPDSRSGAHQLFLQGLRRAPAGTSVLISLGEIDVGVLVFVKAQAAPDGAGDPRSLTHDAAERYQRFILKQVVSRGLRPLVLSTIYPTVESYEGWMGLGGARRTVRASREARASATLQWNDEMEAWCAEHGIAWLDLGAAVDGTVVKPEFVNSDPDDHHYDDDAYASLLVPLLREHGFT